MKHYEVWIHVEETDGGQNHYLDIDSPYEAGRFETEAQARHFIEQELMTTRLSGSAADVLEACKTLTSYTSALLQRMDDQVWLDDIEAIRKAKEAIAKYRPTDAVPGRFQVTLQEQSLIHEPKTILLHLLVEDGQLWIRPEGYGEKCAEDGQGSPVGMEIWEDRLRLVVFDNINSEDSKIINLENARETVRKRCNWCKKQIWTDSVQWKGLLFCGEPCLDACRTAQ